MIIQSQFKPAWWLSNPHLQTLWGTLLRRHPKLQLHRERLELPDNDFLDMDWIEPERASPGAPVILVLHGLGGSIDSHYARGIMSAICNQGWRGAFMHHRGCSGTPNRTALSYHSGYTTDVKFVTAEILRREPGIHLAAIGYSLGGSILLNWLAESDHHHPLKTAVAISVPFDLQKVANHMLTGISRLYQWSMLRGLRNQLIRKFTQVASPIDMTVLPGCKTFWEFDTHVTAPIHGFKNASDYYQRASSRPRLKKITVPTLILHSEDDPFMSKDCMPSPHELSDTTTLEIAQGGGHMGFITGNIPGRPQYWLEQRIMQYLSSQFANSQE